ncbi:myb/SANT-like DNA-binding domain-containing protein 4 isoform X2 [Macrobrachium rosenbergii]|uniref:myb/SANT-like DNA-binding domain-containing protein 4 isoform X2 n=1 Tax=Macrobrachium rosenbergii TaxID=79674 RepID=UPI0034D649A3
MSDTLDPIKLRVAGLPARGLNGRGNKQRLLVLVDRLREPLEQVKNEEETGGERKPDADHEGPPPRAFSANEFAEPKRGRFEERRGEKRQASSQQGPPDSKRYCLKSTDKHTDEGPGYDKEAVILEWSQSNILKPYEVKRRRENWTYDQTLLLVQLVDENKEVIKGKFSPRLRYKDKKAAWQKITREINAVFPSVVRTVGQVEKRWYNVQQKGKNTLTARKRLFNITGGGPPEKVPDLDPVVKIVEDVLSSDNVTIGGVSGIHEHDSEEDISEMKCLGESSSRQNFYSEQLPADEYCEEIPFEPDYVIELDSSLNRHPKRNVSIEPSSLVRNTQEVKPEGDFQSRVLTLMERAVEQQTLLLKEQRKMNQEQREVNRKLYEDQRRLTLSVAKMCESVVKMALSVAKMCESVVKMALSVAKSCESVEKMGLSVATSCESVEKMALSVAKSCESVEKMLEAVKAILKQKVPK